MAVPKSQTLQQRFGFQDKDLTTPKHDEIMMWLDENIIYILELLGIKSDIQMKQQKCVSESVMRSPKHNDLTEKLKDEAKNISICNDLSTLKIKKTWEYPITSNSYIIGFVDLNVKIFFTINEFNGDEWSSYEDWFTLNFEVKTTIPSLGELFRQINMYREYDKSRFIIVSPDNKFCEQIESQGLKFLKYE